MRNNLKSTAAGLAAAAAVAALLATPTLANRLTVSERAFRVVWPAAEELSFTRGLNTVRCQATLEGSFHSRTFSKVVNSLIGYITRAIAAHPCEGGESWFLNGTESIGGRTVGNSLPWHIRYAEFTGTLPLITSIGIKLVGLAFLFEAGELLLRVRCLYLSTPEAPALATLERNGSGQLTVLRATESSIPRHLELEGRESCGTNANWSLRGNVTVPGLTTLVTVTLEA